MVQNLTAIDMKLFILWLPLIITSITLLSCADDVGESHNITFVDTKFNYFYVDSMGDIVFNDAYSPLSVSISQDTDTVDLCLDLIISDSNESTQLNDSIFQDCEFIVKNDIGQMIQFKGPRPVNTTIDTCVTVINIYNRSDEISTLLKSLYIDSNNMRVEDKNENIVIFDPEIRNLNVLGEVNMLYQLIDYVNTDSFEFGDSRFIFEISIDCNGATKHIILSEIPSLLKNTKSILDKVIISE